MSTCKQPSPLASFPSFKSFLLSQSTLLCLFVRLAILTNTLPRDTSQWLHHPALQSLLVRPAQHHNFQRFFATQSWYAHAYSYVQQPPHHSIIPDTAYAAVAAVAFPLLVLLADLVTAYALVHLGNILRTLEHQDDEEMTMAEDTMPQAIRPRHQVFSSTEAVDTCLFARRDLPMLSGALYLWGTALASSMTTPTRLYSGVVFSIMNVATAAVTALVPMTGGYAIARIPSDPFVPFFLIPIYLVMEKYNHRYSTITKRFLIVVTIYYYIVTLPITTFEIPTFSTPNIGIHWYFSMQVFDRFRRYFGIMLFGIRYVLIIPLTIRFHSYHMELTACLWFVYMIFHTHPTVTDLVVGLSLLLLSPRSLCRMELQSLIVLCALPVPLILYLLDWYLWLESGTGNANFIYFQCLAYHAMSAILFIDFCSATVRRQTALYLTKDNHDNNNNSNKTTTNESKE